MQHLISWLQPKAITMWLSIYRRSSIQLAATSFFLFFNPFVLYCSCILACILACSTLLSFHHSRYIQTLIYLSFAHTHYYSVSYSCVRWLVYDHIWCVSLQYQYCSYTQFDCLDYCQIILCSVSSLTVFVYIPTLL